MEVSACRGAAGGPGFQHGYRLAAEINRCLRVHRAVWEYNTGTPWSWLVEQTRGFITPKIDSGKNLAELDGIIAGMDAAGFVATRDDLITYNAYFELSGYWWPTEKKRLGSQGPVPPVDRCSAFIATGSWTKDGRVVMAHNTMYDYVLAVSDVVMDLVPERGQRIVMQTQPGWIHSGTDFFLTARA